jgi:murein DD-endopeptidase MepM/ murein hydrolase activator NlpD
MNVVRQNIIKLVKSKKIKPSAGADMFFLRAKEREDAYEAQQDKTIKASKVSKVKDTKQEKKGGMFDSIKNWLAKFTIGNIIRWLMKGAILLTIFNFIGKLILDPEFRQKVWDGFDKLMKSMGTSGKEVVKNVAAALGVVAATILAFQVASSLLVEAIKAAYLKMKAGAVASPSGNKKGKNPPKGKTPPKSKLGVAVEAVTTAAAVALPFMFSGDSSAKTPPVGTTPSPSPNTDSNTSPNYTPSPLTDEQKSSSAFSLPVASGVISSPYGGRFDSHGKHEGVDIALKENSEVTSIGPGQISKIGFDTGRGGKYVYVKHDNGLESRYYHLNKNDIMNVGDKVNGNQVIGLSGNTGVSTGPHLHLEVRNNGIPVDPKIVIDQFKGGYHKGMLVTRGNTNGERALQLGTETSLASNGNVTYNIDNSQITNIKNAADVAKMSVAQAEDALFKMMFAKVT